MAASLSKVTVAGSGNFIRRESTLVRAFKACWPDVPHQRCQAHFLNNLAEDVLDYDDELRKNMRQDLGGLPKCQPNSVPRLIPPFGRALPHPRQSVPPNRDFPAPGHSRCGQPGQSQTVDLGWLLKGYQQLQAIAQGLSQLDETHPDAAYLLFLRKRVEFVLAKNQTVAEDLKKAHQLLRQVAGCLHYPGSTDQDPHPQTSCFQIAQEMEHRILKAQHRMEKYSELKSGS